LRSGEHSASLLHGKKGGFESASRGATRGVERSLAVSSFRRALPAAGPRVAFPRFRLGPPAAAKVWRLLAVV